MLSKRYLILLLPLFFVACSARHVQPQDTVLLTADRADDAVDVLEPYREAKALLFEGMGRHARKINTKSPEAQTYFNQGLILAYGFNHDEAIRSFAEAAKLDPDCAMAYWGIAYALGPNFNLKMDENNGRRAYAAIQAAIARKQHASEVERELIDAMATRYVNPPSDDRAHLDKAFADAMGALWKKYPKDTDIGYIYAESMMVKNPWDQWYKDGKPKHETELVLKVLEQVMEVDLYHPGANHMYIHATEGSQTPEKAEAAADRLGKITPGIGHMVHMPAHTYMRIGRYEDALEVNRQATKLDQEYFAKVGMMGIYHVYHVHNDHFIAWVCMFTGRYEEALKAADDMLKHLPEPFHGIPDIGDFLITRLHVYLRFGKWEEVLKHPKPREDQPYAVALWHYARGVALANQLKIDEAREEAKLFEAEAAKVPEDQIVNIEPAHNVLRVAREMLAGETEFKAGNYETAFKHLRAAVAAEDALRYTEPSPWMMPTRHALGALLLQQGKYAEAEKVYREDLAWYPENGWSLHGLAECLELAGKEDEAAKVRERFNKAWKNATVEIQGSCFCRTE
jgi:tetratricopeptide (TPR) repeat protein